MRFDKVDGEKYLKNKKRRKSKTTNLGRKNKSKPATSLFQLPAVSFRSAFLSSLICPRGPEGVTLISVYLLFWEQFFGCSK
jgi:hypothetical protein